MSYLLIFSSFDILYLFEQLIISTEHESAIIELEYVIAYSIILIDTLGMRASSERKEIKLVPQANSQLHTAN